MGGAVGGVLYLTLGPVAGWTEPLAIALCLAVAALAPRWVRVINEVESRILLAHPMVNLPDARVDPASGPVLPHRDHAVYGHEPASASNRWPSALV